MGRTRQHKRSIWFLKEELIQLEYVYSRTNENRSTLIYRLLAEEYNRILTQENKKNIEKGLTSEEKI